MDGLIPNSVDNLINKECLTMFPLFIIKEEMFIPLTIKDGVIYVGIVDANDKDRRNSILTKIILATKLKPKVIALTKEQFNEIIEAHKNDFQSGLNKSEFGLSEDEKPKPKKRLGEQLIDDGMITEEQLESALKESKETNTPIGSVLVKKGFITIEQLREALSRQQGVAFVETRDLSIDQRVIQLLPEDFIKDNRVIPIRADEKTVVVGMVNPNDKQTLNDIIYLTGLQPFPLILTHFEFEKCVEKFFETKRETERLVQEISVEEEDDEPVAGASWQQIEREIQDESNIVVKFANSIIAEGIERKASDIHIEPKEDRYIVRYRIDGILKKVLDVPKKIELSLISRLKVISKMDISEHRRAQDGRLTLKYKNQTFDLRLNTLPVNAREKMVIRILQPAVNLGSENRQIELIGAAKADIDKINIMTTSPNGIILATGPTGSGKTTTLYSILNKMNNESVNITTIEDPIEIRLDGINQVQVNPRADITFASCLRAILRQDPDVIMVGEIRDTETLEAAIHAALTGHLVLSTIHTNSAALTVSRLINMGTPPYLISSALIGVVAQRLMRKLCPMCKEKYKPEMDELKFVFPKSFDEKLIAENTFHKHVGCNNCDNTGYIGRIGIYEIMPINYELKKIIAQTNVAHEIEEVAISCGMKTLHASGIDAILRGDTTLEEYIRVLGANNG